MSITNRWRGDAQAIASVDTYVVTSYDVTSTWVVTINGKKIQQVGTGGTAATTATALLALLQATTVPQEFKEITWSSSGATITATATTPGVPVTITATVSGGTGSWVQASVTASSGPNDVSVGANWTAGVIPAAGDTVIVDQGSSSLLYNLNQSAVAIASFTVLPGFTGTIGLPSINVANAGATYIEYRPTYLQYGATAITIQGGGGRIKLDNGSVQTTWNILASSQRVDSRIPQVLLLGTHASNALNSEKGDVAVGWFNEASTILTLNVGYQTNKSNDSFIWLGSQVTLTNVTVIQTGGQLFLNSSITGTGTVTQYGGKATNYLTAAVAQLTCVDATFVYNGTGTLGGTTVVAGQGLIDFSQDLRAKTVTNPVNLYGAKAGIDDPNKVVGSLVVNLNQCSNSALVNIGPNVKITRGTPP